jgi:quercetin dioxygenase-like cupin family protein
MMNVDQFRTKLREDGYLDIEQRTIAPNVFNAAHSHTFDVRALVLEGSATITCDGAPRTFRKGDTFELPAGQQHTEAYGADGYTFLVGRRHPAQPAP